ncbi:helix-turn-helix transcriptional regulator [Catellatospora sp. NPDC049609]|uniref:helix-turn-helix domain-containing protein n=1 Tax=Catellatospora sp. NPDC049609 TaxID=3155505 RepID=UPI003436AEBB
MNLTPRESAVVVLLAKGYPDAAIAAQLDLSVRTIAYTLSSLMERYGVSTRFQLGLRLGAEAGRFEDPGDDEPPPGPQD